MKFHSAKDVIEFIKRENIKMVDLRFMDLPGLSQHFTIPSDKLSEDDFIDGHSGLGFDGSSIRGWQSIHESDMLVKPDPTTAFIDPFMKEKTLVLFCNITDPTSNTDYPKDPRIIAKKAEAFIKQQQIADTIYIGPEAEFFIFDDVRFDQNEHSGYYYLDSIEGRWNSGRDENPNLGYKPRYKEGYFPVPPSDKFHDMRTEMSLIMQDVGIDVEAQHHEVATGGQAEIDMRFGPLLEMADNLIKYKYIVKNVAYRHGKTVTFMPKPLFNDNGSGMHTHLSLWKDGINLFAGKEYGGLSKTALYAIGGVLKHAKSLIAITNPTTNSFKRLVPGYEAPVYLSYSKRNRSAAIRIPTYHNSDKSKRFEFRCPDPSCNPYLAFAALTMAAYDGIVNKIDPGNPLDKNIYELDTNDIEKTPHTLEEALLELKKDHKYLLAGKVFTKDVIDTWIDYKLNQECAQLKLRPHPWEFSMYYDI